MARHIEAPIEHEGPQRHHESLHGVTSADACSGAPRPSPNSAKVSGDRRFSARSIRLHATMACNRKEIKEIPYSILRPEEEFRKHERARLCNAQSGIGRSLRFAQPKRPIQYQMSSEPNARSQAWSAFFWDRNGAPQRTKLGTQTIGKFRSVADDRDGRGHHHAVLKIQPALSPSRRAALPTGPVSRDRRLQAPLQDRNHGRYCAPPPAPRHYIPLL